MPYKTWLADIQNLEHIEQGLVVVRHEGKAERYTRARDRLTDVVRSAAVLAYKGLKDDLDCDGNLIRVSELVIWWQEMDRPFGIYTVFEIAYRPDGQFIGAVLFCYYDGLHPDSGQRLRTTQEAQALAKKKNYTLV